MNNFLFFLILFFSVIHVSYAIPTPIFLLGTDFFLLMIPFILSVYVGILSYFRRHVQMVNIILIVILTGAYFSFVFIVGNVLFYRYEYIFYAIFLGTFFCFLGKKAFFIQYILLILLMGCVFFLGKIHYDIYSLYRVQGCITQNMYPSFLITEVKLNKNFSIVGVQNSKSSTSGYVVVGKCIYGEESGMSCVDSSRYNMYYGGNREIGEALLQLSKKCLDSKYL